MPPLFAELEQRLPDGELGSSTSMDSALARPFGVLVQDGRRVGKINHLFYADSAHSYIVGSLCWSVTGRLIFFPGIIGRKIIWDTGVAQLKSNGIIDHITLEPDFATWHLTSLINGKKDTSHLPNRNTVKIQRGLHYWFGMSVSGPQVFEPAFQSHKFKFEIPQDKADYYRKIILDAKAGAVYHTLNLPSTGSLAAGEFLHFDFLIDRRWFRHLRKLPTNLAWVPSAPPALKTPIKIPSEIPMRGHNVKLEGFKGTIVILVSRHVGTLTEDVILGSAA